MSDDLIRRQDALDAVDVGNIRHFIVDALQNIISEIPSAQPEITLEQVNEFCEERGFVVLTKVEYQWLKSLKSKAEEYRWNGGGNY